VILIYAIHAKKILFQKRMEFAIMDMDLLMLKEEYFLMTLENLQIGFVIFVTINIAIIMKSIYVVHIVILIFVLNVQK